MQYFIDENAAREAKRASSFSDYEEGSATSEFNALLARAVKIAEAQKERVDPMHHERIDALLNSYARRLADNMNARNRNWARVPSVLISGAGNFPTRRKQKQIARDDVLMREWQEIDKILDKIRSVGTAGISADDENAVEKLRAKLEELEARQARMKSINAYYRKHKTLEGCPDLSPEAAKTMEEEITKPGSLCMGRPYASYELGNNNANIRRVIGRIEELERRDNTDFRGWEFDGGRAIPNKEENRLQLIFDDKPDDDTRDALKRNGFRWSPRFKAWQRQLNTNAIRAAKRLEFLAPVAEA